METSLMVNDYPTPNEEKTRTITARVNITYIIEGEVPDEYETLDIERDIKENFTEYKFLSEEIEDIEVI
jgi:hypothetical protein